jgi:hypothetical protein
MSCIAFAISPEGELVRVFDTGTELVPILRNRQSEGLKRYWQRVRAERERDTMSDVVVIVPMVITMTPNIFQKHARLRHSRIREHNLHWYGTEVAILGHQADHNRGGLDHIHWWKSQGPIPEELIAQFEILNENFSEHMPDGELTEAIALEARRLHKAGTMTKRELAAKFDVPLNAMSHAIWGAGRWSYLNDGGGHA